MTLLLLAGIVVLVVTQQATVLYYVKLGMDETTKAKLLDGLFLGLILILAFRLEAQVIRGVVLISYMVFRGIAEEIRRKIRKK